MTKKFKFLILMLAIAAALFIYLVVTSESLDKQAGNIPANNDSELIAQKEKISADYKINTKEIIKNYTDLAAKEEITVEEVIARKNELLNLKVPAEFKDLHVSLVMAIEKMESYLAEGKKNDQQESQNLISEAKTNFSWLN